MSQPLDALADAVLTLWAVDAPGDHLELRLPSANPQLLIRMKSDRLSWNAQGRWERIGGDGVSGPFARSLQLDASEQDGVLGVVFRPSGLAAFTPVALEALAGRHADLPAVLPQVAWGPVLERLRSLALPQALDELQRVLLRARRDRVCGALGHALGLLERGTRVGRVADELGWSQGRLVRRFRRQVGLKPKQFARVARLRRATTSIASGEDLGLVAYRHGFSDQAHLTHELVELAGLTPTAWRDGDRTYATHLRL